MKNLSYIQDVTWDEVFQDWAKSEEDKKDWQKVAREKGWADWRSWRTYTAGLLGLEEREWQLYLVNNPQVVIPKFLVGPFPGWQKEVPQDRVNQINFEDYLRLNVERWRTNKRVEALIENFPSTTQLIGLINPELQDGIVGIEGSHRAMAMTLATYEGIKLPDNPVFIALAKLQHHEKGLLDKVLKLGTENPEKK